MTGASRATEGMTGGGDYDDHSEYQRRTAGSAAGLIEDCAGSVPAPPPGGTFVVADYGCATGRNSAVSVGTAIAAVRARRPGQAVAVIHNDLPTNDWNELFANVASSPALALASAGSFFAPAAPASSVHLGLSFAAAHWLREQPDVVVPEGFYFCEAVGVARAALAARAEADWTAFLAARAADLAPGGRLLVSMVGSDPDFGEDGVTARRLMRAMAEVAREMVEAGSLGAEAVDRYVLPVYARTPAEALAPLRRGSSLSEAFDVVLCGTEAVPNPYLDGWRADGDAAAYARSYAAFVRAFTESSLREHLFADAPARSLDDYFARLEARFASDPERDRFEDWTLTVVLARARDGSGARAAHVDG